MTSALRRHCMRLLGQAQQGDEQACDALVREIASQFSWLIRNYRACDPAYDQDDLNLQFQMGIWQAIEKVDGRGDPLYHLAWRGQHAVRSLLQVTKARRQGTEYVQSILGQPVSVGTFPEDWDPVDKRPESDPVHVLITQADRDEAEGHLGYLVRHAKLSATHRDTITWMLDDPDVNGEGANVRLAEAMGISPQAASRNLRVTKEALSGLDHGPTQRFACEACGRELRSKGALTQHQKGQSGHRPCPALVG